VRKPNSFFAELKRRNVIRMGGLYLVGAWLLIQIAETLLPIFHTPDWVLQALVVLLALGFLPALVLSWVFEITPEGIKRDAGDAVAVDANRLRTAKRLDLLTLMGVVALFAFIAADRYWPQQPAAPADATDARSTPTDSAAAVPTAANSPTKPAVVEKSIAVLPFVNMSADADNEYFSDGIAEEILNALTQVRDLKVAGRTSSFQFKGRNEDLTAIGAALGVAHVLEGSVRKQGNQVRITAQLIHVSDGFHLWSDTYDGELSDIFELQERIARAITDELEVILQGDQQKRLVPVATESPEAYALFLQASAIFNRREGERFAAAIEMLERALRMDPDFARAHARLGALYGIAPQYADADLNRSIAASIEHANAAIALDPNLAEAYAVLGQSQGAVRQFLAQRQSYERALSIDPDDVLSNFWMGTDLISAGYLQLGDTYLDRALAVDPLLPNGLMWRGARHAFSGDLEKGERLLRRADEFGLRNVGLGVSYLEQKLGNQREAAVQLARGLEVFMSAFPPGAPKAVAEGSFGDATQRAAALRMIDDYLSADPEAVAGAVPYALIRLGESKRALEVMLQGPTDSDPLLFFLLWSPLGAEARKLPEFPAFARDIGLTRLWDAYGPPDTCRKHADGSYTCE
jgi:TolB-like protein